MLRRITVIAGLMATVGMANAINILPLFYNTGVDAGKTPLDFASGPKIDPHYTLVNGTAFAATAYNGNNGPWIVNNALSTWITPRVDDHGNAQSLDPSANGLYTYAYQVDLTGYTGASVDLRWSSDNGATLSLNGGPALSTLGNTSYGSWTAVTITGFVSGINTITFDVTNIGQASGNPTGLRVEYDAATAEAVPEPFTMALGASALGLAIARRRRANKA